MENQDKLLIESDDLTIKDIFNCIKDLFDFFKSQFWKIFLIGLVGGGIGFYIAFSSNITYSAKLKFIMKETGGGSALMSSLGSLGSLIGGTSNSVTPMDRILAIIGSERIVGSALLKPIEVNSKLDLAINHLIKVQGLDKTWAEDTLLNDVKFIPTATTVSSFDFAQRKAYKRIVDMVLGVKSNILKRSFDKKSGVFDLEIKTLDENFSIEFSKLLYNELKEFMYNQSLSSSEKNIVIINSKLDSIRSALNTVQNALARNTDRGLGLLMQEDKVEQKRLMLKEQMLTAMYGEAQKNLETFKFVNESINTGFEILEFPMSPINPYKISKIKFSFLGFMLFSFVVFGFLYLKRQVKSKL